MFLSPPHFSLKMRQGWPDYRIKFDTESTVNKLPAIILKISISLKAYSIGELTIDQNYSRLASYSDDATPDM